MADAVKVTIAEHVGLQGLFVNADAVTPDGSVDNMVKMTGFVDAPVITRVAVVVSTPPAAPATIVKVAGFVARLKLKAHGPRAVKAKVTELLAEPLVPVTVTVSFPQKEPVLTVRVEVRLLPLARITLDGLRVAVKLGVDVVADRATVPVNPLILATVTVAFVEEPGVIVAEAGTTLRPKPGIGEPTRVIVFTIRSVR